MLKLKTLPAWGRPPRLPYSLEATMDNSGHGYECCPPSRDDWQIRPALPEVDDEDLEEVCNAEDDMTLHAPCTRREEDEDLYDAYDGDY